MSPKVSLFLATSEMPRHLRLVCAALRRSTFRDMEVLFCDDGSGLETKEIIDRFRGDSGFSVHHVWQEHKGFRKCKILNEALRRASGDICVFLDGDCVPHRDYVSDHVRESEPGRYIAGRRVEMGPWISMQITEEEIASGIFDSTRMRFWLASIRNDLDFPNRTVRVGSTILRSLFKMDRIADMKGCNYSVDRKSLLEINGFDEAYEGYGREDTDVEYRLQNLGLKIKSLKGLALQYHIWHPRRAFTPSNDSQLDEVKRTRRVRCERGVNLVVN